MISPAFWITTVSPIRTSLRSDLVGVVQARALDGRAGERDRGQVGDGRQLAGLADLDGDADDLRDRLLGLVLERDHPARALAPRARAAPRWPRSSTLMTRPSVWKSSVFRRLAQRLGVARSRRRSSRRPALCGLTGMPQPFISSRIVVIRRRRRSPPISPSPCETNRSRRWPQSLGSSSLSEPAVAFRGLANGASSSAAPELVEADQLGVGHVDLAADLQERRGGRLRGPAGCPGRSGGWP